MRPMKKLVRIIALSALVATLWLPALAHNTVSLTTAAVQQGDEEAKAALYQKFLDAYKANPKAEYGKPKDAYDTAKEYLQKYPEESAQTAYMKKYVNAFDINQKEGRKVEVENLLRQQKYADAFTSAKAVLADEPADVRTLNNAVFAALYAAGVNKNESFNGEAANYARKSIQIISSGQPFEKRDDTLGWLNSALGFFSLKTNPTEAITFYIKAAGFEGAAKKDPQTYLFLADAYRASEYTKLASDIKARCSTGEQQATPECKTLTDRLNLVVDRMIDAYARAIALATDPKFAQAKASWMTELTAFYKFRHENTDAGLDKYIAGILSTPLPTQPIGTGGTASAAAPASSQTTGGATGTTTGATTGATGTTTGTTTGAKTTPATTTTGKTPRR
jgi:hypothetical protein